MTPRFALLPAGLLLLLAAGLLRRPAEPRASFRTSVEPAVPPRRAATPSAAPAATSRAPAPAPSSDAFWGDLAVASPRAEDRLDAVQTLGDQPTARARSHLACSATGDVDADVRRAAIEVLGRWQREGDPMAAATASHALRRVAKEDPDPRLRAEAVALLSATVKAPPPTPRRRSLFGGRR